MKQNKILILLAALLLLPWSCKDDVFQPDVSPDMNTVMRAEEEAGNNLSFPVIWSNGMLAVNEGENLVDAELTGASGDPAFEGPCQAGYLVYPQQGTSTWKATAIEDPDGGTMADGIDWGDNLEARAWGTNSMIRVEVVFFKDLPTTELTAYEMCHISGEGTTELWGATGDTENPGEATVFTETAGLVIQRIAGSFEEISNLTLNWDGDSWTNGTTDYPTAKAGSFGAEVNVKGKVIFGDNWFPNRDDYDQEEDGIFRITFYNVGLSGIDLSSADIIGFGEEVVTTAANGQKGGSKNEGKGGQPDVGVYGTDHLTWIDVLITVSDNGGKGGGGNGGGKNNPEKPPKGKGKNSTDNGNTFFGSADIFFDNTPESATENPPVTVVKKGSN